jgi:hypothetical protein
MMRILAEYARREFQDPDKGAKDADLDLLLKYVEVLFQSKNPAVRHSIPSSQAH